MSILRIELFGRLTISSSQFSLNEDYFHAKALELLAYLLLHRTQAHSRETIATLLWSDRLASLSRKYLRKAIWQLQTALKGEGPEQGAALLKVEGNWLSINPDASFWLDVAVFEECYSWIRELPGYALSAEAMDELRTAVALYKGNLLEGWYQDWCLFERERLQSQYCLMVDKLIIACETVREFELGINYCLELLGTDPASERTHRRLMRLYYLSGDRTAAIYQYRRCVTTLKRELGVRPSQETVALYDQIRLDRLGELQARPEAQLELGATVPRDTLAERIRQMQKNIENLLNEIQPDPYSSGEELAD